MKILLVNKFFYLRGGPEIVMLGLIRALRDAGHEVRVFSMNHPENIVAEDNRFFPSHVDFSGSFGNKLKALGRVFGHGDVVGCFKRMLDDFRPDVVHLHNIHSQLSPVVGELAHKAGARVVWTLHDLKLVCPAYLGRRPDGRVCDDCIPGKLHVLRHRCMKGSLLQSWVALMEARKWSRERLARNTDAFIAPSAFMGEMMRRGGFPEEKLHVLTNFIDPAKLQELNNLMKDTPAPGDYFLYAGRLSSEKGVHTLIRAAIKSCARVKLAGDGPDRQELESIAAGSPSIEFLGKLPPDRLVPLQLEARGCVQPSECFENNPLSVIESLCAGTPVIGAKIGGIPELIDPGVNGQVFASGNVDELAHILADFRDADYDRAAISRKSMEIYSREAHMKQLLKIYNP